LDNRSTSPCRLPSPAGTLVQSHVPFSLFIMILKHEERRAGSNELEIRNYPVRSLPLSAAHPIVRILLIGSVLMVTVGLVTWPLVFHLTDSLPTGTEQEATVPLFNAWTLWWVADRTMHGFENFWQAPIFFPTEGAFTFSEPQPLTGLLVFPLWFFSESPMMVYNAAVLLCLFLNGVFAYRLLNRGFLLPFLASLLGGVLLIGLPFTAKLLGVLPLIPLFGLLWALEGLVRFGREGSWRTVLWTGTGLLVQLWTSQQLTLLFTLFLLPAGIVALHQQEWEVRSLAKLVGVAIGIACIAGWFAWYPLHVHQALDMTRSESLITALSARPSDYLSKPLSATLGFPPRESHQSDTGGLFPGVGLIVLACWGAWWGLRQQKTMRVWIWYLAGTGLIAWLLSMGINSPFDGGMLFSWLREWVPGFHELRSPFRFAVFVQLCLVLLGCLGLSGLSGLSRPSVSPIIVCLVGTLVFAENLSISQPLITFTKSFSPPWSHWIKSRHTGHILGHIPFPSGLHVSDYQIETKRMLAQITHRQPLINGYSGFFPPGYTRFQLDMAKNFPSPFLMCFLGQELMADTLIIDLKWYKTHQKQLEPFEETSEVVYRDEDVVILDVPRPDGTCDEETPEDNL
jgi:hypothetical protein